ncbi:MAG: polysaccharide deacetylase family protein [Verrucomicrobia bacterium]|nr:polysaccharide deacetylase family protein [Verrucomicrobiota bacterium]
MNQERNSLSLPIRTSHPALELPPARSRRRQSAHSVSRIKSAPTDVGGYGDNATSRREFLRTVSMAGVAAGFGGASALAQAAPPSRDKALIAITLDLEMARNFPRWEDMHWDYEKGNLNDEAKRYAVEAARRVKAHGGVIHFFAVGQVFEQENVDWMKALHEAGHPIGNHTYDHVFVLATKPQDIQYRFARAPWLIAGKTPAQVIRENIQLCTDAMRTRLGFGPAGFRTPGGFADGLNGRTDVQQMMLDLGFKWVSCKYPVHLYGEVGKDPTPDVFDNIVKAQQAAQPFVYPTGLIDVPMSPISDIGAFRNGRWKLEHFLKAIRLGVEWAIEHRAVFDLLSHPSVLYPSDPEFKAIELVCELVKKAGNRAAIVDLDTIAKRVAAAPR